MSGELENIAMAVAPQVGLPLKVTRWVIDGVVILAIICGLGWGIWKLFFAERAAEKKHDQVQQQVTTGLAKTGAESGKQAVEITVKNNTAAAGVDRETQKAIHDLLKAPGANTAVDPGLAMLARRAICLRTSAARLDGCNQVRGSGP